MALAYVPKRHYKGMGLLGLGQTVPTRTVGVQQRVAYATPARCDKCGSSEICEDRVEPRRFFCNSCYSDWFLVRPGWEA